MAGSLLVSFMPSSLSVRPDTAAAHQTGAPAAHLKQQRIRTDFDRCWTRVGTSPYR